MGTHCCVLDLACEAILHNFHEQRCNYRKLALLALRLHHTGEFYILGLAARAWWQAGIWASVRPAVGGRAVGAAGGTHGAI